MVNGAPRDLLGKASAVSSFSSLGPVTAKSEQIEAVVGLGEEPTVSSSGVSCSTSGTVESQCVMFVQISGEWHSGRSTLNSWCPRPGP